MDLKSLDFTLSWYHNYKMLLTLKENFNTFLTYGNEDLSFTILQGYTTDGGTIPKILWSFLSPYENYFYSCLLHDYLCFMLKNMTEQEREGFSVYKIRSVIDKCLLYSMRQHRVKLLTRYLIYYGVRIYSFFTYNFITLKFFKKDIFTIAEWNAGFLTEDTTMPTIKKVNKNNTINTILSILKNKNKNNKR